MGWEWEKGRGGRGEVEGVGEGSIPQDASPHQSTANIFSGNIFELWTETTLFPRPFVLEENTHNALILDLIYFWGEKSITKNIMIAV